MKSKKITIGQKSTTMAVSQFQAVKRDILNRFSNTSHAVHRVGEGHTDRIFGVVFTPDGKKLLTASWDRTAMIWDCATGLPEGRFVGHKGPLSALSLAPDGTFMATGGEDETVRLWDIKTRQCIYTFRCHPGGVDCVLITPDGKHVLTGGRDATAILWSLAARRQVCRYRGHTDNVSSVCVTEDGKKTITCSYDGDIRIWEYQTGTLLHILHTNVCVNSVCTTPEGHILAAYANNDVRLWSLMGECLVKFRLHTSTMLRRVAEKEGISGRKHNYINSFSVTETATNPSIVAACTSVAASKQGKYYFSTGWDKTCRQGDYEGRQIRCFQSRGGPLESVAISPDEKIIATGGWDGQCCLWDVSTGEAIRLLRACTVPVAGLALSPDNLFMVTAGRRMAIVWDLTEGRAKYYLSGHTDRVNSVAYSSDGRYVLTAGSDGVTFLWNMVSGKREAIFENQIAVSQAVFSPDTKFFATAGLDGKATIYHTQSRLPLYRIDEHLRGLSSMAFTPDSKRIALASGDNSASLCDIYTGRRLLQLEHPDEVRCISISPDGEVIATGCLNGEIRLWELKSGRLIFTVMSHKGEVNTVTFNRESTWLISGGADGQVRIWLWREGRCIAVAAGHSNEVASVALSSCERRLFSGGFDHNVHCWDCSDIGSFIEDGKIKHLSLLVSLYHLEEGFLWTTPPAKSEHAEGGWFWTDRSELIRVERSTNQGKTATVVQGKDRDEYFTLYCRKDMVMNRLIEPGRQKEYSRHLNGIMEYSKAVHKKNLDDSIRRRLGPSNQQNEKETGEK